MSKKKKSASQNKKPSIKTESNGHGKNQERTATKKAEVLGTEKKGHVPLYVAIAFVALIAGFSFFYFMGFGEKSSAVAVQNTSGAPVTEFTYPVTLFEDGKARHYAYKNGNMTIKYFVLKSSDGVIRAAFDACDVCWPQGKGYQQSGDDMVCRNCGRRFASVLVNEVKGGCNPSPLNRTIVGDQLVIKVADILEGKQYFNFSGRT